MSGPASRVMKFPYTFSAKIAQFPYKFHIDNIWLYKYYLFGILASAPVFYKIGKASYAPNNVRVWDENRRREFSGHPHH